MLLGTDTKVNDTLLQPSEVTYLLTPDWGAEKGHTVSSVLDHFQVLLRHDDFFFLAFQLVHNPECYV